MLLTIYILMAPNSFLSQISFNLYKVTFPIILFCFLTLKMSLFVWQGSSDFGWANDVAVI